MSASPRFEPSSGGATSPVDARSARTFEVVLAICALASVVPLFCARHLPMLDLPEHLASMATIRHYGDPAWKGAEYFTVAGVFETPYWLYHAVGALLTAVMGSAERANVVMLSIVGLGYPYALRSLLVALRRDPRLPLFGCALFWGGNLMTGLLNFVASVPLVLVALALVIQQAEAPTLRRGIGLAAVSVALFYLHLSSFGLFVLDAALLTWMLPVPDARQRRSELARRLVRLPARMLWLAPSSVVGIVVLLAGRTVAHGAGPTLSWHSRLGLVRGLPAWLFDRFQSRVDDVLGAMLVLALGVLLVAARKKAASFEECWRSRCVQVLAAVATIAWLASPSQVGAHAGLLDIRMAVFVALFAVMLPNVRPGRPATLAFSAAAACAFGLAVETGYEVRAFERDDVAAFDEMLRAMPRGKRLVSLNLEPRSSHTNGNVFSYFGSYYRARYGGVASFSFSETSHWPVRYRPGAGPPSPGTWANACLYRNERDGAYFDYVLVHGERNPFVAMTTGPSWELVGASRRWQLFKKSDAEPRTTTSDAPDSGPCG